MTMLEIEILRAFLARPSFGFADGTFLTWGWVIGIVVSFSLIPGALILSRILKRERLRIFAETHPAIRIKIMDFCCGYCWKHFKIRPVPYETVFCPYCNDSVMLTPLPDELDYEENHER